jgi:hypothetical protein
MKKTKKKKHDKSTKEDRDLSPELGTLFSYGRRLKDGFRTLSASEKE